MMTSLLPLALLASICTIQISPVAAADRFVTGKVIFNGPKDLPSGSHVQIQLQDTSLMDAAAKVMGTVTITDAKSFPISYKVKYNPSEIIRGHTYSMSARITAPDGKLRYINDMHIGADVSGNNGANIDIPVIQSKQSLMVNRAMD